MKARGAPLARPSLPQPVPAMSAAPIPSGPGNASLRQLSRASPGRARPLQGEDRAFLTG